MICLFRILVATASLVVVTPSASLGGEGKILRTPKDLFCPDGQRYLNTTHGSNCTDPVPLSKLCPDPHARCKVRDNPDFYKSGR